MQSDTYIMKYFLFSIFLFGCSQTSTVNEKTAVRDIAFFNHKNNKIKSKNDESIGQISQNIVETLKQRRNQISQWVSECDENSGYHTQISDHHNSCDQGDVISWAGYTCLASHLAGDDQNKTKRCRDVSLAQGTNGRWWRGQSRIENQNKNSFSRDMSLGVMSFLITQGLLSDDPLTKSKTTDQALAWLEYLEHQGNGYRMCDDDVGLDNRCSLVSNTGKTLYKIFDKLGIINAANKDYKFVKKFSGKQKFNNWYLELLVTPVDYQLHLKSQEIFFKYIIGLNSDTEFKKFTKKIYQKDPLNPWYEFLHLGPTDKWVNRILEVCPAQRLNSNQWVIWHSGDGDWAWQRDSKERAWEIANGHDCVFLLNLAIAQKEGKINLPFSTETSIDVCENTNRYLGEYQNKNVCKKIPQIKITEVKCSSENGIKHSINNLDWCLEDKGDHYKAREIKAVCPLGHTEDGEHNGLPICRKNYLDKIRLYKCVAGQGNHVIPQWTQNHEFCYINKNTYFQKKEIGEKCPITNPTFENEFIWGAWPVCKSLFKIKKEECTGPYKQPREDHCLVQENGWFAKKKYKSGCPFGTLYADVDLFEKPLCKPIPHLKIKESKCTNQSGTKWNGWCVWDKGEHYKARQLK